VHRTLREAKAVYPIDWMRVLLKFQLSGKSTHIHMYGRLTYLTLTHRHTYILIYTLLQSALCPMHAILSSTAMYTVSPFVRQLIVYLFV